MQETPINRPTESTAAGPQRRNVGWLMGRWLPGLLAALLFLAFVNRPALGVAAPWLLAVLMLAFAGALVVQPATAHWMRRLRAWPGLAHTLMVAGVVALGAGLRFWGLRFGLPYLDHPDEWAVADRAVRMLQTGDFNPGSFVYPSLYTYMQVAVAGAHVLSGVGAGVYQTVDDIDPARFYVWGRALTALLGTAAVLLTYLIGRRLYGPLVGLLAGLFLAVYPSATGDAHYITTDTPSMFFTLLAFLVIVHVAGVRAPTVDDARPMPDDGQAPVAGRWPLVLLAGVLVGLAAATKYNVAVLVVPLLVALVLAYRPLALASLLLVPVALFGAALGFTLGTPYWFAELRLLLNDMASVVVHYRFTGHPGAESDQPALFYWGAFVREGALLAWITLGGVLLAFMRHRRADVLLLAFVVPYFIQMTGVRVVFFRNTMPLIPFLCLFAAIACVALVGWLAAHIRARNAGGATGFQRRFAPHSLPRVLLVALPLLIVVQPLAQAARDNHLRAQPTTRVLATEWVETQSPDGTRVWLEDQTLILPQRLRVQGGPPIASNPPEWYTENGFRFLVVNLDTRRNSAEQLAAFGPPVAEFLRAGERHGPNLVVFDTGAGDASREERTASGATLGGGALVLDGYRHPGRAHPGEVVPLALYWQVVRELPQDYTVFVHLFDADGTRVAQRDTPPLDGSRPTSTWQPGELLRDDQDLALPPDLAPGTYSLVVGMYDSQTLAAITDSGPIPVGEIEIGDF